MVFEIQFLNNIYIRRFFAASIDFGIEIGSGLLGGYFGAMVAALVIVLNDVSPMATQKAIWAGMTFGFLFWSLTASLVNRVLIQGMSRATIGKKMMELEIVSIGAPIQWKTMLRHWVSASIIGELRVVSSSDTSQLAQVISIQSKPVQTGKVATTETQDSSDKKAA